MQTSETPVAADTQKKMRLSAITDKYQIPLGGNMKKGMHFTLLATGLLALTAPAMADTVVLTGSIDGSEPTFDQPISMASALTSYDTIEFTVDTDGMYSFLSFYAGSVATAANLDGALFLYAGSFDPIDPLASLVAGSDDLLAGEIASLSGLDGACEGPNCSGFEANLTAGTSYVIVQSTFTDTATSFGQPTGPYEMTITGPGAINAGQVPLPGAVWLMLSAMAGFGALRRRVQ